MKNFTNYLTSTFRLFLNLYHRLHLQTVPITAFICNAAKLQTGAETKITKGHGIHVVVKIYQRHIKHSQMYRNW